MKGDLMEISLSYMVLSWLLLIAAGVAFWLFCQFRGLKNTVYISIREMGQLLVLLAKYDEIEKPEQKIARIMNMTAEEVALELEQGRILKLISMKASEILAGMKISVPEANKLFTDIEEELEK